MSDLFTRYANLETPYHQTFFAGANTADGFIGAYDAFIREAELTRLFILKGGSGTGKSSLIKTCAEIARKRGSEVTMLLCSSDPSSADAVILRGKNGNTAAIVDGTAPHTRDPLFPGAVSRIVNAGDHWDSLYLQKHREEITLRTMEKKEAYERAYRFLGAYRHLTSVQRQLLLPCIDGEKMAAAAQRIAAALTPGKIAPLRTRYTYALSMTGAWHLPVFTERARIQYRMLDAYGTGSFFLQSVQEAASVRCPLLYSPIPACPEYAAELYAEGADASFSLTEERTSTEANVHYINMQRFLYRKELAQIRTRLRFTDRCREMLFDGALDALSDARRAHFALEEIYKSAMDFDGLRRETNRICEEIGDLLG